MKKIYLIILLTSFFVSCQKDEIEILPKEINQTDNVFEEVSFKDLASSIKNKFDSQYFIEQNGLKKTETFGSVRTDIPAKMIAKQDGTKSYTFLLKNIINDTVSDIYFDNLVIIENNGAQDNLVILRYKPSENWQLFEDDINTYSGSVTFYTPMGEKINSIEMKRGLVENEKYNSQRKSPCTFEFTETGTVCTDGGSIGGQGSLADWNCHTSYIMRVNCNSGGSGSPSSGDGGGPGSEGGGYSGDDGNSGGDDTGLNDFEFADGQTIPTPPTEIGLEITTIDLAPCLKAIVNNIQAQNHLHGIGEIFMDFSNQNSNLNWNIKSDTLSGPTGSTSTTYNPYTNSVNTTFDSFTYTQGTDLSWVRTILHETAHAYVVSIANISSLTPSERQELLGENWITAYSNQGHDFIAQTYITSIADILQEYGNIKGYTMDRPFYEDLAWGGLQNTSDFNQLSTSDQQRILDVIAIELTGKDTNGNNKNNKGTNAGC